MPELVSVESGSLRGIARGSLLHFRAVPYATAERFGQPRRVSPWTGVRDAAQHGPTCPQPKSALEIVMGVQRTALAQDENCLTLTITAPALPRGPRPVMVWLHGGSYLTGAGSYDWYAGDALALEGDVIVVGVNYRLGVFGYLHLPGVSPAQLGLRDQIAALSWLKRNVAAFGGDPERITVFGQSAGAHSIAALMSTSETRGLFRRAIIQSAHLGTGFSKPRTAERVAALFEQAMAGDDPRTCSTKRLLEAQAAVVGRMAGPGGLDPTPAFGPIAGLPPFAGATSITHAPAEHHPQVDVLIGTTRHEMRALFEARPPLHRMRLANALGASVFRALSSLATHFTFAVPALELADQQARAGAARVFTYRLDWSAPGGPLGACHTIDLPFLLGDRAAWEDAPMLGGAWESTLELGREMRRAWTRFAHAGDPSGDDAGPWPRHRPGAGVGMRMRFARRR